MEYKDIINRIKAGVKAIKDPMDIANKFGVSDFFSIKNSFDFKNILDNKFYQENQSYIENIETDETEEIVENNETYSNKSNENNNKKQVTSLDPEGVIESITKEMTPDRLRQAVILSEIIGKPRSKTRKRRRF